MAVIGAKDSLISTGSAVACVKKWSVADKADSPTFVCSTTRGAKSRVIGNKDWSGSWEGHGDTPPVKAGDAITFTGVIGGTPGSQIGVSGSAIVKDVTVTIDQKSGAPIMYTVNFEANGALSESGTLNVTAPSSFPTPKTSKGCAVLLADPAASPSFTELADVQSVTIKMSVDLLPYVSSTTAGQNKRVVGNFDCEVTVSCFFDALTDLPALNAIKQFKIMVDDTLFWDVRWAMVTGRSGIDCDRETGAIVGATITAGLVTAATYSGSNHGGYVKDPATTAVWDGST